MSQKGIIEIGNKHEFDEPDYVDEQVNLFPNGKAYIRGHSHIFSVKGSFEMTNALPESNEPVEIKNGTIQNVYILIQAGTCGCSLIFRRSMMRKKH